MTASPTAPILASIGFGRPGVGGRRGSHTALPSAANPRVVVPNAHPRAAAAVLGRSGATGRGLKSRIRGQAVNTAAALVSHTGLPPFVGTPLQLDIGPDSLVAHLRASLDLGELVVACRTGPPRPNAKPVLQLLTPDGTVLAFAKVGVNDLTAALVQSEITALQHLHAISVTGIVLPRISHHAEAAGVTVLVTDPVETNGAVTDAVRVAALRGLASTDDSRTAPLADSRWFLELRDNASPRSGLLPIISRFAERFGADAVHLGIVHGDFTPWNVAGTANGLAVWDWERMMTDAPLGIDALHYELEVRRRDDLPLVARINHALSVVVGQGTVPGDQPLLIPCYLMDQAVRHLGAGVPLTTAHRSHLRSVVSELERYVEITDSQSRGADT